MTVLICRQQHSSCKQGCQKFFCGMWHNLNTDVLVLIRQKFLNYSKNNWWCSQVAIKLSEKEKTIWYCCFWICFNIYLYITYFIGCMKRYTMRGTRVPWKVRRSTKFLSIWCSSELVLSSENFCMPEKLILQILACILNETVLVRQWFLV